MPRSDWMAIPESVWFFDQALLTLELPYEYQVDLERCLSPADMLDWIIQVSQKTWATDRMIAGLVRAFDYLLRPQETMIHTGSIGDVRETIAAVLKRGALADNILKSIVVTPLPDELDHEVKPSDAMGRD